MTLSKTVWQTGCGTKCRTRETDINLSIFNDELLQDTKPPQIRHRQFKTITLPKQPQRRRNTVMREHETKDKERLRQ